MSKYEIYLKGVTIYIIFNIIYRKCHKMSSLKYIRKFHYIQRL